VRDTPGSHGGNHPFTPKWIVDDRQSSEIAPSSSNSCR
jgi:hypothetical protein